MTVFKRGNVYWYNFKWEGQSFNRARSRTISRQPAKWRRITGRHWLKARSASSSGKSSGVQGCDGELSGMVKGRTHDKPATYRRYVNSSVPLLRHFKSSRLDKISAPEVEQYKTARLEQYKTARSKNGRKDTKKKIQPATVNRELACLRMVFNHAIKSKIDVENPVGKMGAKAFRENNEQTRVLSYDEEMKYLAAASSMLHDVAAMILDTGMRPEEVYRILPANVHLAKTTCSTPTERRRPRSGVSSSPHERKAFLKDVSKSGRESTCSRMTQTRTNPCRRSITPMIAQ